MSHTFVVWFHQVDKEDIALVGGKGANLGEMTKAGFPVPPGFIVTARAYAHFLDVNRLKAKMEMVLHGLDVSDSAALERASKKARDLILTAPFPRDIANEVIHTYFTLDQGFVTHASVAVRSSATAEDLPAASFAGQQETYLNVYGEANLIESVKAAWSSLFTARAIFYRATHGFDHFKVAIAVVVQRMVASEASGIMFTIDPVSNDKSTIVIEAIYGLGELIVQGAVTPDHYEVEKGTLALKQKSVHVQDKQMVRKKHGVAVVPVAKRDGARQKITDAQIRELAALGKALEAHYFFPQDAEWAIEKGKIYLVQTRPVTTTGKASGAGIHESRRRDNLLVKGDPASPGIASGPVRILSSPREIHRIGRGDVLVAEMTNPDYVPAMRKAVAIVTERGGRTSHAAIVSRELGIPAVVGAKDARRLLADGDLVTVNGSSGEVYKGAPLHRIPQYEAPSATAKTATKVYVNLAEPSRAKEVAAMQVDGVGLLRAEFMIAGIGTHPKKLLAQGKREVFVHALSNEIKTFCAAFSPRPVVYRATDFKTNEYRHLTGGAAYEPEEPNPMLGFRGAARYTADPDVFAMELDALKAVRNRMGYKNLWIMIPFVRTPQELAAVKTLIAANGLPRSATFKLWMMAEIPTNVIRIDDFLDVGIDGVSIGSNDLTMLTLGTDRDNSDVSHDFSELDPAVLWSLERVITACSRRGVTSSICGQAPSDYPELVEKLVRWGVTSVSVNPDAIRHVRETVARAEHDRVAK